MGAAYSQANTNTVLGSSQGSGMRTNLSNNPPEVFQNWVGATAGLSDVGFGFFTAIIPAPRGLIRPAACSSTSRTRACGGPTTAA